MADDPGSVDLDSGAVAGHPSIGDMHSVPVTGASDEDIVTDPDALVHTGQRLNKLAADLPGPGADLNLLSDEMIGNTELGQSVRAFVTLWEQRVRELGDHVDELGTTIRQTGHRYRATEAGAATTIRRTDQLQAPDSSIGIAVTTP